MKKDIVMKTDMDYEQKYKRALERAREYLEAENFTEMADVFPELSESEDERIRKFILEVIKTYDGMSNSTKEKCISYLEKQKYNRMKPIYDARESFESALAKAWKEYNDSGSRIVDGCEDDYVECAHAKGFREGYLFGIGKQKECVADSSKTSADEDERIRKAIIKSIEEDSSVYEQEVSKEQMLAWLEKQKEQKPAQTSEEKEYIRTLKSLISDFIRDKQPEDVVFYQKIYDWLDGRHIEQKQEWSEEDEKLRRNLMSLLANMRGDRITEETYQKYYPWLKSLRSSWKPSEEQMSMLLAVINDPNNAGAESCYMALNSIYNNLKKLM